MYFALKVSTKDRLESTVLRYTKRKINDIASSVFNVASLVSAPSVLCFVMLYAYNNIIIGIPGRLCENVQWEV